MEVDVQVQRTHNVDQMRHISGGRNIGLFMFRGRVSACCESNRRGVGPTRFRGRRRFGIGKR